jgi:hypothetical protein
MSDSSITVVDDWPSSPQIKYDGQWVHLVDISPAVNHTLTFTPQGGASITFRFNGDLLFLTLSACI